MRASPPDAAARRPGETQHEGASARTASQGPDATGWTAARAPGPVPETGGACVPHEGGAPGGVSYRPKGRGGGHLGGHSDSARGGPLQRPGGPLPGPFPFRRGLPRPPKGRPMRRCFRVGVRESPAKRYAEGVWGLTSDAAGSQGLLWPGGTAAWGANMCKSRGGGGGGGGIRMEGATEAVRKAVGGGCRSGWGRLLSVTNAIEAGTWRQGDSDWA